MAMLTRMMVAGVLAAGATLLAGNVSAATSAAKEPVTSTDYKVLPAGVYTLDPHHASLHWSVSHMGFSNYTAKFDDLSGTLTFNPKAPTASSVSITVPMTKVATGFNKMDEELKGPKFFNTGQFPTATFVSNKFTVIGKDKGRLSGNLTLLGVTKPVVLDVTLNGVGKNFEQQPTLGFSAATTIKRSDFGMTEYMGVVGDTVKLRIEAEFNQK